jgi:Heterokaryon incompatibility protein (HET)
VGRRPTTPYKLLTANKTTISRLVPGWIFSEGMSLPSSQKSIKQDKPAASTTTAFTYRPLRTDIPEIRLLQFSRASIVNDRAPDIECSLIHVPLDYEFPYITLSYVWGDPSITQPIWIDGMIFQTTENAYQALRSLCLQLLIGRNTKQLIWIDAICIDQSNSEEKSQQVQLMKRIYENAIMVVIWIGEV